MLQVKVFYVTSVLQFDNFMLMANQMALLDEVGSWACAPVIS
jgi:hypothetical protein